MGEIAEALDQYRQSRAVYQEIGNEQRAAEQDVNLAALEINFGGDLEDALRRLSNARVTLRKLGYVHWEVTALEAQSRGEISAGRLGEALRLLNQASSIATERQMNNRLTELKTTTAVVEILQGNYETARQALEPLVASGVATAEARLTLARAYLRMGDFQAARAQLERAGADARARGEEAIGLWAHELLGELAYESGRAAEALEQYQVIAALEDRRLPNGGVLEARCHVAVLDVRRSVRDRENLLEASIAKAREFGQGQIDALCAGELGRVQVQARRFAPALVTLRSIGSSDGRSVDSEVQLAAHHWRSLAFDGLGDRPSAESERLRGKTLASAIHDKLPEQVRSSFRSRESVKVFFE
jgi:tetratricopeptide (TPR) repeat protein